MRTIARSAVSRSGTDRTARLAVTNGAVDHVGPADNDPMLDTKNEKPPRRAPGRL